MSEATRTRLVQLVRRNDADLAEAALLVAAEADPTLDVQAGLLRLDALADQLRVQGLPLTGDPAADGRALASALADQLGFRGHAPGERGPDDGLLPRVLDRRRGLPITLSIVQVALARRFAIPAYTIALPGHVVVGVGQQPTVLDPFHGGLELDEAAISARVTELTGGRLAFRRAMLRPAPAVHVVRRLLNNLTHDFSEADRLRDALWTVELKQALPNRVPDDHRVRGRLLDQLGRFDAAAEAFEAYLEASGEGAPDREEVRRAAIRSRARLN